MSLINQVLKDLERRQAPERPESFQPVRPSGRRRVPLAAWWVVAAVGIGVALHWLLATDTSPHPAQSEIVQATFHPREIEAPVHEPGPQPPVENTDDTASQPAVEPAETEPADSAPAPAPAPTPVELAAADRPTISDATEPASGPPAVDETIEPDEISTDRTISIERADDGHEHDLDSARRAIARGHHQRAERQLEQLLEQQPDHDEARDLLATHLLRRGRTNAALDWLEQGLHEGRDPARFALRIGRILLERDQVERARTVLETHAPASPDPDFQQLLAAAHRQAGDHAAAEKAYRRLTEIVPQRAAAWIGLGVSLEALDRPTEARQAYGRVLESGDPQATRFARQRLRAIQISHGDRS